MIELLRNFFLWFNIPFIISILIRISGYTWRIKFKGLDKVRNSGDHILYAFWHENIIPLTFAHRGRGLGVIVSPSSDGEIAARVLKILGYKVFRGDTDSRGREAIRELIEYGSKGKEIAITPDGPKGPRRELKRGVFVIARRANIALFGVRVYAERYLRLSSWDKLMLPYPFSRILITIEGPLALNREEILSKYM